MRKWLAPLSFIALSTAAASASAEPAWPKWYVGLTGGVTFLDDADVSGTSTGELGFDTGWAVTGSIGYLLADPLRIEFEAGYHENDMDNVTLGGVSSASTGHVRIASYMVNAFYDMRSGSQFIPYIGGGVGVAQVKVSHDSGLSNLDDQDTVLAYQGMAGIAYAPQSMPMTEWSLGYRLFVADSPEYRTAGGSVELDNIMSHSAEIGGRFRF